MADKKLVCSKDPKHPLGTATKFCPECGSAIVEETPKQHEKPANNAGLILLKSVCPKDAKHVTGTGKFCQECGTELVNPLAKIAKDRAAVDALTAKDRDALILDALTQTYTALALIQTALEDLHPGDKQADKGWFQKLMDPIETSPTTSK